jgi:hypothetical protein
VHEILDEGRRLAALTIGQLWWSYVAIGGTARPTEVAGFMSGEAVPDAVQYDLLAQVLNDSLTGLGLDHSVPYSPER